MARTAGNPIRSSGRDGDVPTRLPTLHRGRRSARYTRRASRDSSPIGGRWLSTTVHRSKQLRDTDNGVRIEFLVTGAYPGDGKPKPIAFPQPNDVAVVIDGMRCLALPRLIELKLASGTAPGRLKDLGDVQELIRILNLQKDIAEQLNPSVQESYRKLWAEVQASAPED